MTSLRCLAQLLVVVPLPLQTNPATTQRAPRKAEIVYADGRHQAVNAPSRDSKGEWTVEIDGCRGKLPGDVVVVIDQDAKETETIRSLPPGQVTPSASIMLALLLEGKEDEWRHALDGLAAYATSELQDALVLMTNSDEKKHRLRSIHGLARLRTRESVAAATTAILAEKDTAQRRAESSVLLSVQEIFRRSDALKSLANGLADKNSVVRATFALISPRDCATALAVLRNDGLKSGDNHIRESAALELGRRHDASGETILTSMVVRTTLPGVSDPKVMVRLLIEEQVAVCQVLGELATPASKAALEKALASKHVPVQEAAKAALEVANH